MRSSSSLPVRAALLALLLAVPGLRARAYALLGSARANGNIVMQLQLGSPSHTLLDGSTTWAAPAVAALNAWNAQMVRCQFTTVMDSTVPKVQGDSLNSVFFSPDVFGDAWGSGVLGITLSYYNAVNFIVESDVLFNTAVSWDSYRGAIQHGVGTTVEDFQRVALHEFGHALGLDHPDTASPPQTVAAVMNSTTSNTDSLQADDIAGVKALYGKAMTPPTITSNPVGKTVPTTGSFTFSVGATGTDPLIYTWFYVAPGGSTSQPYPLAKTASYTIGSVQPGDAGRYYSAVSNLGGYVYSNTATLTVTPVSVSANSRLVDISTRSQVGTGDSIMIAGFVVGGSTAKTVLIRAVGPTLVNYGISGALADPHLDVVQSTGAAIASNDNWETGNDVAALNAATARVGGFNLNAGSKDAALLATLAPGVYSARVSGANNTTGIALVEVYDADADRPTALTRKLLNISTRGLVGAGDNVLIAGLVVDGPAPRRFLIRALGPTLANYGVNGALDDPLLQVYDSNGQLLHENDDWDTPASGQAALLDAANAVGAGPLQVRRDAAMLITLNPGLYSAKVTGVNGKTGVALVEIYEMPN